MEEGVGSEVEPIRAEMKDGVAARGGFVPTRLWRQKQLLRSTGKVWVG